MRGWPLQPRGSWSPLNFDDHPSKADLLRRLLFEIFAGKAFVYKNKKMKTNVNVFGTKVKIGGALMVFVPKRLSFTSSKLYEHSTVISQGLSS